jgi:hypothetical protein
MKMPTKEEIDAFEKFEFRIGQKVVSRFGGGISGFITTRALVNSAAGVHREYAVRHGPDSTKTYMEYELDATP